MPICSLLFEIERNISSLIYLHHHRIPLIGSSILLVESFRADEVQFGSFMYILSCVSYQSVFPFRVPPLVTRNVSGKLIPMAGVHSASMSHPEEYKGFGALSHLTSIQPQDCLVYSQLCYQVACVTIKRLTHITFPIS